MGIEITKIHDSERIHYCHCSCTDEEDRPYLSGLLAPLHRLIVRMLGGCCRKTTARFGASLTGRMVAHNVLAQGGGRGSKRWEEAKKGGKTISVNKEDSQLLSSWENNRYQPIIIWWGIRQKSWILPSPVPSPSQSLCPFKATNNNRSWSVSASHLVLSLAFRQN